MYTRYSVNSVNSSGILVAVWSQLQRHARLAMAMAISRCSNNAKELFERNTIMIFEFGTQS